MRPDADGLGELTLVVTMESEAPLPSSVSEPSIHSMIAFAMKDAGEGGTWEIGLLITTDGRIRAMHREFMGLDSPTDIMTFPYEADEFDIDTVASRGGDIVISVDTAAANAADAGWDVADEVRFLTLHGVLHILGWDDADPAQRAGMLARQLELLDGWRRQTGDATG